MAPTALDDLDPSPPLAIEPWPDPVIDRIGHDPRSSYVEHYWLTILGPSTTFLLRRLADRFDDEPDGFVLDLQETARAIGLGGRGRVGKQSPFQRALARTCQFGLARQHDETLVVRRRVPPLTHRQVERLPDPLRGDHEQWQRDRLEAGTGPRGSFEEVQRRARRVALSLLELGEEYDAAERQLHRWHFHPAVAFEAVAWAHETRTAAQGRSPEGAGPAARTRAG